MRVKWAVAALLAVSLRAASSVAADGPVEPPVEEPIRVAYYPAAGCPPPEALISSLRASTPRFRPAFAIEPAREFSVATFESASPTVGPPTQAYVGRLTIRDLLGNVTMRDVRGDTCSDVVAALAFVAALAIDPNATPPGVPGTPSRPPTPALLPPVVPAPAATPAVETPKNSPDPEPETRLFAAVRVGGVTGVGSSDPATPFGRVSVEVARYIPRSLGASVALSVARGLTQEIVTTGGDTHFTWTTGRLDLCPVRWALAPRETTSFELCPFFEAGTLSGTSTTRSQTRGWVAAGALARLGLRIAGPVSFEVETGIDAPIRRYHFYFTPPLDTSAANTDVFRVPAFSFSASVGFSVQFL